MNLAPIAGSTQRRWVADLMNTDAALRPWVREHPEGFSYVDPSAPADLVRVWRDLIRLGYARGWFA